MTPRLMPAAGGGGNSPSISGVSGTVSGGNTLTVSGSQLINEDTSSYDSWFTDSRRYFKGATAAADGYQTHDNPSIYVTTPKLFVASGHSAWSRIDSTSEQVPGFAPYGDGITGLPADFYARFYWRIDTNGVGRFGAEHKMIILYKGGDGFLAVYPFDDSGPLLSNKWYVDNQNGDTGATTLSQTATAGKWFCMVARFKTSGSPFCTLSVNGSPHVAGLPGSAVAGSPTGSGLQVNFNWSTGTAGFVGDSYINNFALSTSQLFDLTLVEIGNSATYASATKVVQAMTSASDTSIDVTCDLTGLGAGPYWMFVTNNRQLTASYAL